MDKSVVSIYRCQTSTKTSRCVEYTMNDIERRLKGVFGTENLTPILILSLTRALSLSLSLQGPVTALFSRVWFEGEGIDGTRRGKCKAMHGWSAEERKRTRHMWKEPSRSNSVAVSGDVSSSSSCLSSFYKIFTKLSRPGQPLLESISLISILTLFNSLPVKFSVLLAWKTCQQQPTKQMGVDSFDGEDDTFDWNSGDERYADSSSSSLTLPNGEARASSAEASSSAGSSGTKLVDHFVGMGFSKKMTMEAIQETGEENADLILETLLKYSARSSGSSSGTKLIDHFVGMGFSEEMVAKAIRENGEGNTDSILETLLTYRAIDESPEEQCLKDYDQLSSDFEASFLDDFSDMDSSESEEIIKTESEGDNPLFFLKRMGYPLEEASIAIERCGPDASIAELTDFLCAAQLARAADVLYPEDKPKPWQSGNNHLKHKKRSALRHDMWKRKKQRLENGHVNGDEEPLRIPIPMIGFGVPTEPAIITRRTLPEAAFGPPYFYYENVALAPKGVWQTISRFLYDVEPEFVDSKHFCAAARKRGYVHNLPLNNRFPLLPFPARTIQEAFPLTKKWWPSWDARTKLNCLQTCIGSAKLTERIRKAVEDYDDGNPPPSVQKYVLDECRKWNLVWVGRNKVAPLEPDEIEMLLGFPKNHTRGGGISRTDRYKSLGNSFQVDTVAYHLSVLKDLFPEGLNLLSLFSGIGGAEVALHRLGIRMKNVVSVEISEVNRGIMRCWWEQTNQTGNLIDMTDIQQLNADRLEEFMSMFGGFDLVVGGSPCNNLTGSNRVHRDGLEGKESSLFFDYCRILDLVKCMMSRNH
ncbi:hypothetical protein K2173_013937 [Erythroxylum novogranatense]|uniref:DNA (cytosine-5-)-methyltransferase n=1 Tax=Erythroxylum novogranatense TaxID=1862640 RepID=A0AAV8SCR8_9ROSI|nr:hypothetical protein K2173_013937 [Erythroxylum novogranatense]